MVRQDFNHLAQVAMSIKSQFKVADDEFEEVIRRFIWAIRASPNGSHNLDDNDFRDMCMGKKGFETDGA